MKKILIVAGFCLTSSMAFAAGTTACKGTGEAVKIDGVASNFVRVGFSPKCSANTWVAYEQNAVAFAAAGGSAKGKQVFGGTSGGGGVNSVLACPATGCTEDNAKGSTAELLNKATL